MIKNDRILKAARREKTDRPPVWLMRQAGRYMAEYQAIRKQTTFMGLCKNPKLAAEVTLQPYHRFGMDALIIFSDILVPVEAMGMKLDIVEKTGPVLEDPIRTQERLDALTIPDARKETGYVLDVINEVKSLVKDEVPVLGFGGAPWTLACYMVEGGSSKHFIELKKMMYNRPELLHALLEKITETIKHYLAAQLDTGVDMVQLFDTWAGELSRDDYREFALPYLKKIIDHLHSVSSKPVILYTNGVAAILDDMIETGADCISVDWRIDLAEAKKRIAGRTSIQGNVDPCVLFSSPQKVTEVVKATLEKFGGEPGLIFNLGHGILPTTPPASVEAFVNAVKSYSNVK